MSREERRQYERMMKNMERGAALPPAARARAERNAARRDARRSKAEPATLFDTRFWVRTSLIAAAIGFFLFSLQWPNMPFALYVGVIAAATALASQVGIRLLRRRAAAR